MDIHGSAVFEEINGWKLRLRLDRWWDDRPRALICGANPSYAGADKNDPTIWRVIDLCQRLDVGGFTMLNWEPYIATDPDDLHAWRKLAAWHQPTALKAVRQRNFETIEAVTSVAGMRFIAWGNLVPQVPHATKILTAISQNGQHDLYAFGLTKGGFPKHPMARGQHRISADATPVIWQPRWQESAA